MTSSLRETFTVTDQYGIDPLSDVRDNDVSAIGPEDTTTLVLGQGYAGRPDLIALDFYGDDNLWWVVQMFNGIVSYQDIVGGMELTLPLPAALTSVLASAGTTEDINTDKVYI